MINAQALAAALRAAANSLDPNPGTAAGGALLAAPASPPPPPPPAVQTGTITDTMISDLIMPHIGNETVKAALGVAMRALGVNNLPEAQPHQYPSLYQSFQQVLAAHGIGGAAPPPVQSASII